jgi:hypothetical protein
LFFKSKAQQKETAQQLQAGLGTYPNIANCMKRIGKDCVGKIQANTEQKTKPND